MLLHAIIDRNLRLCYTSNSGIVDSGHLTALTGIYLGVAHQVRGSGARAGRYDDEQQAGLRRPWHVT